jgi:hypothetical protein
VRMPEIATSWAPRLTPPAVAASTGASPLPHLARLETAYGTCFGDLEGAQTGTTERRFG